MNRWLALTERNIRLYLRDTAQVFFSFLSAGILVMLYFMFIANHYVDGVKAETANLLSESALYFLVYSQMMAGVIVLNSVSLATGALLPTSMDFVSKRYQSFQLTPLASKGLVSSYLSSAFLISLLLNSLVWLTSLVMIGSLTGYWLSFDAIVQSIGVLLVSDFVSCGTIFLMTVLVKSVNALGVFNGVAGTFLGFLCGIYIPYSTLGASTELVGSVLPWAHLVVWGKQIVLGDAYMQLGISPAAQKIFDHELFSSENLGLLGNDLPLWMMLLLAVLFALICLIVATFILSKRVRAR
ncbi:MAG: hypothetical protein LBC43_04335 [Bifidobacteriaceae bacterium]|jgi:multidrug/hemolysin transport system permease protein|nr:hypothetical protein [Bifidobacteriaceae bacterium]